MHDIEGRKSFRFVDEAYTFHCDHRFSMLLYPNCDKI
jgi:hypothetical protein